MTDHYAAFPSLTFERPAPGVLHIVLDAPGLNAVGPDMHRELADVWLTVDRDPDVRVAMISGAGKAFSAAGGERLAGPGDHRDAHVRIPVHREPHVCELAVHVGADGVETRGVEHDVEDARARALERETRERGVMVGHGGRPLEARGCGGHPSVSGCGAIPGDQRHETETRGPEKAVLGTACSQPSWVPPP